MKKTTIFLTAVLALALSAPAFAADTEYKSETTVKQGDNGDVKADTKTEQTDQSGTTTTNESQEKIDKESNGDYTKKVETESKRDPKGLFNTKKTKTKDTVKKRGHKITKEHIKKENGTTTQDTKTESEVPNQNTNDNSSGQ